MNKIEVKQLTKIFGSHPKKGLKRLKEGENKQDILKQTGLTIGVNQATFSVKKGETYVIMGLSGSGKSTLIRLINRLIDPTDGEVLIDGEDITKMDQKSLMKQEEKSWEWFFKILLSFPIVLSYQMSHMGLKYKLWIKRNGKYRNESD